MTDLPTVLEQIEDPVDGTLMATLEPRPDKICQAVLFRTDGTAVIERDRHDGLDDIPRVCVSPGSGGCAGDCPFCVTGQSMSTGGFTPDEIYGQARLMRDLGGVTGQVCVTIAGMNDVGFNLPNAIEACRYMTERPEEFASVSLSTIVPHPNTLSRLAAADLPIRPYISVHAPDDKLRDVLVPFNRQHPLDSVIMAGAHYAHTTGLKYGRKTVASYLLLDDEDGRPVNCTPEHAHRLAAKLDPECWQVMVLMLNEDSSLPFRRISDERAHEFSAVFAEYGLHAYVMPSSGRREGINAACGLLRARPARRRPIPLTLVPTGRSGR